MRLSALEKNILVYRALQMALFLFYAETLRREIIGSVEPEIRQPGQKLNGGKLLQRIFDELVAKSILTKTESDEVQSLLEHRNTIAHKIHSLTCDIEPPGRNSRFRTFLSLKKYDYQALGQIKRWHVELPARLAKNYWLLCSPDSQMFEAAEHAYEKELISLRKRIDRLYALRSTQAGKS